MSDTERVALLRENNVVWQKFFPHKRHTLNKSALLKATKQRQADVVQSSLRSLRAFLRGVSRGVFTQVCECSPAHQPVQEVS